ncbi:hypothetical protein OXX69_012274 [Metschnikowia pulcherrima]
MMAPSHLKVHTSALERLMKERTMYLKEVEEGSKQIEEMKSREAESYEIKKQEELVRESQRAIVAVDIKLEKEKKCLSDIILNYDGAESLEAAKDVLKRYEIVFGAR